MSNLSENGVELFLLIFKSVRGDFLKKSKFECEIQSDQQESKSEQALQIIGHVVAKSYAHKRSKHWRGQFMVSNAT
jgi:hypothetical protein